MKARILIVEDNLITMTVISRTLEMLGHSIAGKLMSGEDAVAWMANDTADLILMDIQLDGAMDGIEAAAAIHEYSDVPIVYLTANSDLQTVGRAGDTSASGYLHKPFDERGLDSAIRIALGRHASDIRAAQERARLESTLAALSEAIIAADATGAVTSMNTTAERLTGWRTQDARGKDITEVLTILDEEGNNQTGDLPGLLLGEFISPVQRLVTLVSRDGEKHPMHQCVSPIVDKLNRLTGIVLALHSADGI